nr:TetR/AcrR family transcriptional regulator [Pseudomaricurvus alkylphenolicus]
MAATERVILKTGVDRVSILDVCKEARISRGTFYRYYSSQDELLDAFSRYRRNQFHTKLVEALEPYTDPDERFDAFVNFLDAFLQRGEPRQMLIVAPAYSIGWYQRIFHDSINRFEQELSVVFDAWEERSGVAIDRELVCEMILRYIISHQLVPANEQERRALPSRIKRLVRSVSV